MLSIHSQGQVVINELGIGARCPGVFDCDDSGGGAEFIELFNKSGCNQNIGCYVIIYSGPNGAGWSVTLPNITLSPGQYYLIGGYNSSKLFSSTWSNGTLTNTTTWKNNYGNYGNDIADLDLGKANTSGKRIVIGNLNNTGGQVTLINSTGTVLSSIAYYTGNNSNSYPASINSAGCNLTTVNNPGNAQVTYNDGNNNFTSYRAGLYLDASGNYQLSYNEPVNSPTPGKPNLSQTATSSPASISVQPLSQSDCKENNVEFNVSYTATGTVNYQWQSSIDNGNTWTNISGASGSTNTSPLVYNATNIGVNGLNTNGTQYRVIITDANGCGITSSAAVLTVNEITGITPQNTQTTLCEGGSFSFTVTTSGNTPNSYQWRRNGINLTDGTVNGVTISGATSATLTVTNAKASDSGSYDVTVVFPITTPNNNGTNVTSCSETSTLVRNVTVNSKPTPTIYHN